VDEPATASGSTAYGALVEGEADREGMELAWRVLCQAMELSEAEDYFIDVEGSPEG
jgi:hypothetical protein